MKGVLLLLRVSVALLLTNCCVSFSMNRPMLSQSLNSRRISAERAQVNMKQSNFEDEAEQQSLSDIINNPAISIGAGVGGIFILLANRLSFGDIVSDVQSRADIISVIACSALLLNALSEQDITARTRDAVPLVGYALKTPLLSPLLDAAKAASLTWCINSILKTTPATSVHIILDNNFLARGGVVGTSDDRAVSNVKNVENMPILQKTLRIGEEIYLPDLQVTFSFLFSRTLYQYVCCKGSLIA